MEQWLPLFFMFMMQASILVYTILDGHDLGMGMLLPFASDSEKDQMMSALGPF